MRLSESLGLEKISQTNNPKKARYGGVADGRSFAAKPAPGTIGDVSSRIGYDVRDLLMAGYSHSDIAELEIGSMTLQELRERGPSKK